MDPIVTGMLSLGPSGVMAAAFFWLHRESLKVFREELKAEREQNTANLKEEREQNTVNLKAEREQCHNDHARLESLILETSEKTETGLKENRHAIAGIHQELVVYRELTSQAMGVRGTRAQNQPKGGPASG